MGYRSVVGGVLAAAALLGSITVTATATAAPGEAAAACTWRATALSVPNGGSGIVKTTDRAGGFTGSVKESDKPVYLARWKNGEFTNLGNPYPGRGFSINGENRSGVLVGEGTFALPIGGLISTAFQMKNGVAEKLPQPAEGFWNSGAVGVTDAGDVYGWIRTTDYKQESAVRWPAARPGTIELINHPAKHPSAVDPAGAVLIDSKTIWRDGVSTTLSTPPNLKYWSGSEISNGHVVGYGTTNDDRRVSLYWNQRNVAHVLPKSTYNLSGGPDATINTAGRVIARLDEANGGNNQAATGYGVWDQGQFVGTFGDLKLDYPTALGDDGSVGGYRGDHNHSTPYSWRCG